MAKQAQQQAANVPGTLYGVPGITQRFEQYDTTRAAVTTLSQTAQVPWNNVFPFQKTDVVLWWELVINWTNTPVANTDTLSLSPYAPYNLLQGFNLQMQGQYKPIDVLSGFDAWFFQTYRPMRGSGMQETVILGGANVAGTYANAGIPQANLVANASMTTTTSPVEMILEIPGCLWFDQYWDLAEDGTPMMVPFGAHVSPQYMGGGERVVQPRTNFAAGISSTFDQGPIVVTTVGGGAHATYTGQTSIDVRRNGVYMSTNPAEMPPVMNWQYQRRSRQFQVGAASKIDIPITDYGQILSLWVRLFDPSLGSNGSGGAVPIGNISVCQLLYGSNLPKFDDVPTTMQWRFLNQHGFLPPVGTVVWDMAITDASGKVTNAKALNTLTNANVKIHLEFSVTPGAQTYAVVGVESLVFIANQ